MTVYRLNYNSDEFPRVDVAPSEWMKLESKGVLASFTPKDKWQVLNATYYDEPGNVNAKRPDIMCWTSHMVFSDKAYQALKVGLDKFGSFYPVDVEGELKQAFYENTKTDAIDPFNSEKLVIDGEELEVIKLAFLEHEVKDLGIFRTEYDNASYIYCTDEVKELIEGSLASEELTSGWTFEVELRGS